MKTLKTKLRCLKTNKLINYKIYKYSIIENNLPLDSKKFKIGIVGSGPAGFYVAKMLQLRYSNILSIDIFEKLPHPFGLIRTGIAPDHQEMKNAQKDFLSLLENENINLLCNVEITDSEKQINTNINNLKKSNSTLYVEIEKLIYNYSAIVLCCGANGESSLFLENEKKANNIIFSRDFVNWYNGCIETSINSRINKFNFADIKNVTIIGNGNVAIDIARLLSREYSSLVKYDIPEHVLNKLKYKNVENIHIIGRRGAVQSAFSTKEIRELSKIANIYTIKNEIENSLNLESLKELQTNNLSDSRLLNRKFNLIKSFESLSKLENNLSSINPNKSSIYLRYFLLPCKLHFNNNQATKIEFNKTKLTGIANLQKSIIDNEANKEILNTDLIINSIGYKTTPIFKDYFAYDSRGIIKNNKGLVEYNTEFTNKNSNIPNKVYTSGWMKRGANGILDMTLKDTQDTYTIISNNVSNMETINNLYLKYKDNKYYCYNKVGNNKFVFDYKKLFNTSEDNISKLLINKHEIKKILKKEENDGLRLKKIAEKIVNKNKMIEVAKSDEINMVYN